MSFPDFWLRCMAEIVPPVKRDDWLAEWRAELWHVKEHSPASVRAFCRGAIQDALWLRWNTPRVGWVPASPLRCIAALAFLASVTILFALQMPNGPVVLAARLKVGQILLLLTAIFLLPATTSLDIGRCPRSARWWTFFIVKTALISAIVAAISLGITGTRVSPVHPHAALVGYVIALRWSLCDQRRRCPTCLRRLTKPTRIGGASHTFLEWYGMEFICNQGHGLLYVSEVDTSASDAQRWVNLDSSWEVLFPGRR